MSRSSVCNYGCFSDKEEVQVDTKPRKIRVVPLILAVCLPLLVGCFSAFLTADDMKLYDTMNKPPLAPPGWLFPIVWTILYAAMGVASYLVFASYYGPLRKWIALKFYFTQLAMNMFWPILFFTYGRYLLSFVWLLVMWVEILICAIKFYKINKAAGFMMCGVFLWTTFAAYLNLAYYIMSITPAMLGD